MRPKHSISILSWEDTPASGPGDKFRRSNTHQFMDNTPTPFKAQHNFGTDKPGEQLRVGKGPWVSPYPFPVKFGGKCR